MRYEASVDRKTSTTFLSLSENCHTDSVPLIRELFFRNAEFDIDAGAFALAAVVLTHRHVGEQAEFSDRNVAIEFALAMQIVCPRLKSVAPINGLNRAPSVSEIDIACAPARLGAFAAKASDGIPLMAVNWTGDSVDRASRKSTGFAFGRYFTNAGMIADDTLVSIAIGLMHGGQLCRKLIVPLAPGADAAHYVAIGAALHSVGIALELIST